MDSYSWGREYLLVSPKHYDVQWEINPYMDASVPVDKILARAQWANLHDAILEAGGLVKVFNDVPKNCLDMVYAMNLAYVTRDSVGTQDAILASMAFSERRPETVAIKPLLEKLCVSVYKIAARFGSFEPGDVFPWRDKYLLAGIGERTKLAAAGEAARLLRRELVPLRAATAKAYHLDLSFAPLTHTAALIWPDAYVKEDLEALLEIVEQPIFLTEEEAVEHFSANSIVVNDTVIMPARTTPRLEEAIAAATGFRVVRVDVSEFEKGGGSIRCLANSLDFPGLV